MANALSNNCIVAWLTRRKGSCMHPLGTIGSPNLYEFPGKNSERQTIEWYQPRANKRLTLLWSNICDKDRASNFDSLCWAVMKSAIIAKQSPGLLQQFLMVNQANQADCWHRRCETAAHLRQRGGTKWTERTLRCFVAPPRPPIWDVLDENQQRNNFPKLTTFWLFLHEWHQLPHSALLLCIFHWKATDTVPHSLIFDCN